MKRSHSYNNDLNYSYIMPINICIIGAGRAGNFHVNSLLINKQYKLKYIIDLDLEKAKNLAQKANCKYSNDLNLILSTNEIDAVIIATTTPTHYDLTMKCISFNKHIFCEKPLGKSEQEITDCFKFANARNLKLLVAYQKRFDKNYSKLYELLNKQRPKNIKMSTMDYPLPPLDYLRTSNGIVEDMITHDIDMANLYMNFDIPEKVIAFTYTHNQKLINNNEIEGIEILMHYKDGAIVNLFGTRDAKHGYDQRVEILGDFGLYQLENQLDNTIKYTTNNGCKYAKINYSFSERYEDAYKKELDYFYKMITENYSPLVEESHLLLSKKICNAINESINTKKIVYLDSNLRQYEINTPQYYLYRDMHQNQTVEFVQKMKDKYKNLSNCKINIKDVLLELNNFIDPSDPDVDIENSVHAYQTAERIRKKHPNNKELQVVGLIHDLGKILFKLGEPNWAVVGDTYVVGCKFPESIVYYDTLKDNPDYNNKDYNTELGIYKERCGLERLLISFGHDEYLYQVLLQNKTHKISKKLMKVIRFHSFYPWHTGGAYKQFMNVNDEQILKDVLYFNQFDLYSKEDIDFVLTDEIKEYYDNLLDEYFPEDLQF